MSSCRSVDCGSRLPFPIPRMGSCLPQMSPTLLPQKCSWSHLPDRCEAIVPQIPRGFVSHLRRSELTGAHARPKTLVVPSSGMRSLGFYSPSFQIRRDRGARAGLLFLQPHKSLLPLHQNIALPWAPSFLAPELFPRQVRWVAPSKHENVMGGSFLRWVQGRAFRSEVSSSPLRLPDKRLLDSDQLDC